MLDLLPFLDQGQPEKNDTVKFFVVENLTGII